MSERRLDGFGRVFLVLGMVMLANAIWMLAGPFGWYTDLPAAVPDTGPFNEHFVRDIGCAFLTVGVALVWAAFQRRVRVPLVAISALFLVSHALLHVYDTARGALGSDHWQLDFLGVYLPAVVVGGLALILFRREAP
ncbi:MAG: hypothetical protein VX614_02935 [Myxococcota bacterium]|nr:hypothetical protein [Myxococcota bacterium]